MKKTLLIVALALLTSLTASAQFQKGKGYVGASLTGLNMSYNGGDDAVNQFLQWVLTDGTKFNHEFGLLNLDNKLTQVQIEKVKDILTAQK